MGIDECRNRKFVLCPVLFWQKYRSPFPVQDGPVHFESITLSVEDYADWLKEEYDRRRWFRIELYLAQWLHSKLTWGGRVHIT